MASYPSTSRRLIIKSIKTYFQGREGTGNELLLSHKAIIFRLSTFTYMALLVELPNNFGHTREIEYL